MNRETSHFDRIVQAVEVLMAGPETSDRPFLLPGATYGQVYAMAAHLCGAMVGSTGPVCVFAENRAVIAAALIAGLFTRRPLLLPHAVTIAVMEQLRRQVDFTLAVVDRDAPLPFGVQALLPVPDGRFQTSDFVPPPPDTGWVYLFTGGSTGRPRIWSKTVENLIGEAAYLVEAYGFSPDDRIVATVPALHIYGLLYSVLAPLISSAGVSAAAPSFPREIAAAAKACRATILVSVPVHYRAMKETDVHCPSPRLAFSSAGPLDADDADAFFQKTGTGVTEIYGSTETGGIAARCRAEGRQDLRPFSPVDWKIAAGQLHVRSPFLSPELPTEAKGFFKTGDRAAAAPEGGFTLLGRTDGVVKVGGKRVDTEEIRERIRSFPGVREAVVAALPTENGRQSAIGALVEGDVDPDALRRQLADHLAPQAVPRRIRVVGKIPVTAAGKFDRQLVVDLLTI